MVNIEKKNDFIHFKVWNFVMQLKSCFGFDTFFAVDVRRFGDGGIFIGNLRKPIEEVMPKLQKKLSEAAGREVEIWFMEERNDDITKQVRWCNFIGLFCFILFTFFFAIAICIGWKDY